MSRSEKQIELEAIQTDLVAVNQARQAALVPLKHQIDLMSRPFDEKRRQLRQRIEELMHEVLEEATTLPMHRLEISRTWECPLSPIRWCVYADHVFDSCVFCRQPEERK